MLHPTDDALAAIAHSTRRAILRLVWDVERPSGEIAAQFKVTGPAISQHLRVLRVAGLVTERRAGTRRLYRARPETLASVRAELESFWADRLGRLNEAVATEEGTP
jgi:DNA-binding transcriptional ArsR family regulator